MDRVINILLLNCCYIWKICKNVKKKRKKISRENERQLHSGPRLYSGKASKHKYGRVSFDKSCRYVHGEYHNWF